MTNLQYRNIMTMLVCTWILTIVVGFKVFWS
jgi:hypothetical protein